MSLFGDESSDAGELALLEQKKIKRVISEMHEDLTELKGSMTVMRRLETGLAKLEGSVSALVNGQSSVTVDARTNIDGDVQGDIAGGSIDKR